MHAPESLVRTKWRQPTSNLHSKIGYIVRESQDERNFSYVPTKSHQHITESDELIYLVILAVLKKRRIGQKVHHILPDNGIGFFLTRHCNPKISGVTDTNNPLAYDLHSVAERRTLLEYLL